VTDEYPEVVRTMDKWLTQWSDSEAKRVGTGDDIDIDEEMRSRLADLGYLDHEM